MLQARAADPVLRPHRARSAVAPADAVALLMAEIGEACGGPADAMGRHIKEALRVAAASPDILLPEWRVPCAGCYARHMIGCDPAGRFTVLSLVWSPGQCSPPHAHDIWCAYAVVESTLTETLFTFDAARGIAVPAGTVARAPGYACFAGPGLEQIHRLAKAGVVPAISIHVYGVEGSRVGTHVNRLMDIGER